MSQQPAFTNRLAQETSPYLKQHANNPVDWYPWGPEALARARELNRPIFLSIGYSACHWCHVMEHESFENDEVAEILNRDFVSIKVDREERPDLDHIYMSAVMMLTGQGGWPMSMFLTPELKPFYGGTYFPPDDRYGRPGFKRLLRALADAWHNRHAELVDAAEQITDGVRQATAGLEGAAVADLQPDLIQQAARNIRRVFDSVHGGFGSAPKFPHSMELRMLLRAWRRFGDGDALAMTRLTLDKMAMGGMYDHLGGGFHRYSTDERWLVPHFEKMLYDNALLADAYLEGYQATGEPFYRQVVEETLDYVRREMTAAEGGFFSTQDADSEGVEGKFFVWSRKEIEAVLGKEPAELFAYVYDVSAEGNWEGHNILNRAKTLAQDAGILKLPEPELRRKLSEARQKLLAVRSQRVWPGRDEKILTSWNGLMIGAFARAAAVLEMLAYADAAVKAATFLLSRMRSPQGLLFRTITSGSEPKLNAYLEDYAFLIDGLVSLYETTGTPRWLTSAADLAQVMLDQFADPDQPGFFSTARQHEELIARAKEFQDSSIPSGNSLAATALLRLAKLTGRAAFLDHGEATLRAAYPLMAKAPQAAGQMLIALDFWLGPVQEFAIVGDPAKEDTRRVLRAIHGRYRPGKVVALKTPDFPEEVEGQIPLLKDKPASETVTTYICENFACQAPLAGAEAVENRINANG